VIPYGGGGNLDKKKQFIKGRIKDQLETLKRGMGDLRHKVYLSEVDSSDDEQILKGLSDLSLQIEMLKYIDGISDKLSAQGISIDVLRQAQVSLTKSQDMESGLRLIQDLSDENILDYMALALQNREETEAPEEKYRVEAELRLVLDEIKEEDIAEVSEAEEAEEAEEADDSDINEDDVLGSELEDEDEEEGEENDISYDDMFSEEEEDEDEGDVEIDADDILGSDSDSEEGEEESEGEIAYEDIFSEDGEDSTDIEIDINESDILGTDEEEEQQEGLIADINEEDLLGSNDSSIDDEVESFQSEINIDDIFGQEEVVSKPKKPIVNNCSTEKADIKKPINSSIEGVYSKNTEAGKKTQSMVNRLFDIVDKTESKIGSMIKRKDK